MSRHNEQLYTPGNQTLGRDIVRLDQDVLDKYNGLEYKAQDIRGLILQARKEIDAIDLTIGQAVVERDDRDEWKGTVARAAQLGLEIEALEKALQYIEGQRGLLRRYNAWLT